MKNKEIIETLTADVERLMKLHSSAMKEVATLREKNGEQSVKIRSLQEQLREAKAQAAKASLSEALTGGNDANKAAARAQLNRLLREVERCIDMVSNRI